MDNISRFVTENTQERRVISLEPTNFQNIRTAQFLFRTEYNVSNMWDFKVMVTLITIYRNICDVNQFLELTREHRVCKKKGRKKSKYNCAWGVWGMWKFRVECRVHYIHYTNVYNVYKKFAAVEW